ncbi:MAG: BACON domain-containing protein [Flectobacillus sp.]|uniref:BACON domain-containing protein n=1 Tax=Flectobacillus sp. TaxID=50419 RepID=UPI003B99D820
MNTLRLLLFPFLFLIIVSCRKDIEPPTISLSSTLVDLGTITSTSASSLTLSQVGDGTISYSISSNKSWLVLSKNSGSITINQSDIVTFGVITINSDIVEGENVATLTITPTINGSPSTPIQVIVKGNFKQTTISTQTQLVDFGTISKSTTKYLKFNKVGIENLTYDVSSDNSWLTIDKTTGSLVTGDSLKLTVDTKKLIEGNYTANITFTPKVNGNPLKTVVIPVKVAYDGAVSGDISGHLLSKDEIWSDVVNLNGTIVIPKGYTLTIKPGTVVNVTKSDVSIQVYGKLVMNGDASNIIVMKSASANPTYYDWSGIEYGGGNMEISYAFIKDAVTCLDFYYLDWTTTPTQAVSLHHILFDNCQYGLYGVSSSFASTFSNLTFRNIFWASAYTLDITNLTFSNVEFNTPNSHDIRVGNGNNNITIENSNFVSKNYIDAYHLFIYSDLSNCKINLNKCYFQTTSPISLGFGGNGNIVTNTTPQSSTIGNIGCGFTSKFPNSVRMKPILANMAELQRKERKASTRGTKFKVR